jgi:hypothetical protein
LGQALVIVGKFLMIENSWSDFVIFQLKVGGDIEF